jgi:hypothetical protein
VPRLAEAGVDDGETQDGGEERQTQLIMADIGRVHRGILIQKGSRETRSDTHACIELTGVPPSFTSLPQELIRRGPMLWSPHPVPLLADLGEWGMRREPDRSGSNPAVQLLERSEQ